MFLIQLLLNLFPPLCYVLLACIYKTVLLAVASTIDSLQVCVKSFPSYSLYSLCVLNYRHHFTSDTNINDYQTHP